MFKKIFSLVLATVLILATVPTPTTAQTYGPKDFGFVFAADYGKWLFRSTASVTTGAQTMTIQGDAFATTQGGRLFYPLNVNAPLIVDLGASQETVTPSAVTCNQNALQTTCSFTATFSNAHNGGAVITSGTFGLQEAINDIGTGTVVISNYWGGTTTTLTTTTTGGTTTANVLDARSGNFTYYKWGGSSYAGSTAPLLSSPVSPAATFTAVAGTTYFYTGNLVQSTNHSFASVAGSANTAGATLDLLKTRSVTNTSPATTTIVTADDLGVINAFGADGTNYIKSAQIEFQSTGTIAATRVPSKIIISTSTDATPSVLTSAVIIDKDQSVTPTGGLKTATANSGAAGFSTRFADTGSPAAGTTGTNTTGIANQLWYTQIYIPYNITATNIGILSGGTATTDKIAIGIWTTDGQTLVRATAATVGAGTVLSGANTWQKLALTSTVTLSGPARYIVGVVTSGATAGDIQTYPLASGPLCAVQTGMGTLATTFTPVTTATAASCPYLFID